MGNGFARLCVFDNILGSSVGDRFSLLQLAPGRGRQGLEMDLEEIDKSGKTHTTHVDMSTKIEQAVAAEISFRIDFRRFRLVRGRWLFYVIVFAALALGCALSIFQFLHTG